MFFNEKNSVLNISQMYLADSISEAKGKTVENLMENAGFAVASEIFKRYPKKKILVLCGLGNNGGDGFVVARILKDWGFFVEVFILGNQGKLKGAAKINAELLAKYNISLKPFSSEILNKADKENTIIVDAIFGAGLTREIEGIAKDVILEINKRELTCVGVDIPSGVSGDDGSVLGEVAVKCDVTVTFCRKKPGHLLYPGKSICGEVVVADIGIDDQTVQETNTYIYENSPDLWKLPIPDWNSHKYKRGHVLVVGGYPMTGASRLAAISARKAGAGLVSIAVPKEAFNVYAMDGAGNIVLPYGSDKEFQDIIGNTKINTILVGPGAGVSEGTLNNIKMIANTDKDVVVDADGISAFANNANDLKHIKPAVITPHEGEMLRVFPEFSKISSKLEKAQKAAEFLNCVVVLKGADTIITSPCGKIVINSNASPYLATAGAGDVLAGMVSSFLAQGVEAFDSACAAVWVHGEISKKIGKNLIAEDLIMALNE